MCLLLLYAKCRDFNRRDFYIMATTTGLTRALRLIEELRKLDEAMPASHSAALMVIAKEEGLTQQEAGKRAGASKSGIQRMFDKLSERGLNGKDGLNLIEVRLGADQRERRAFLTSKGRRVIASIQNLMED